MANSLGGLIVTLGLDAAEFFTGLTKSEYEAKKFAERLDRGIATAANVATIALAAMGTAAIGAFAAVNQLARQAGDFQDLAEKTGANAESLASFAVAAGTAGSAMSEVAAASVKLTKNLTGVDDESKDAGAALAALGLNIKEFKSLDPAAQMETIAKALGGFAEGAGKTAVAVALLGKSGADLLPFLKELGGETGRVNILTKEQIRLADEYSDKQARASATLNLYAQMVATQILPAITNLTDATKEYVKEIVNTDKESKNLRDGNAITDWANTSAKALAFVIDSAQGAGRVFRIIGDTIAVGVSQTAALMTGDIKESIRLGEDWKRRISGILEAPLFSAKLDQTIKRSQDLARQRAKEDRGFDPRTQVNFAGATKAGGAGGADKISEAERYLQSLEKQLEGTLELTAAETAEVRIWEMQKSALSGLTEERKAAIRDNAAQIDAMKELKKAEQEAQKQAEEAARRYERIARDTERRIDGIQREAKGIRDGNERIQEQIAFLRGGEEGLRAYTDAKLAKAIAENIDKEAMAKSIGATKEETDAIRDVTNALKETQAQLGQLDIAKKFAAEAKNLQDVKNALSDALVQPLTDFVTGTKSAKDAAKAFFSDLQQQLTRLASQNVANMLFGGKNSSGPDFFAVMAKFLGMLGGGAGAAGISATSGGAGIELGSLAGGTTNWRGGPSVVGENGPEILNIPRGAQVTTMADWRKAKSGGTTNVFHVNVMPGATSASVRQTKAMLRDAVMSSARDR